MKNATVYNEAAPSEGSERFYRGAKAGEADAVEGPGILQRPRRRRSLCREDRRRIVVCRRSQEPHRGIEARRLQAGSARHRQRRNGPRAPRR